MSEAPFVPRERLIEKQKYFQSIHKHTYLKGPYDKITSVAIPVALAASSLFLILCRLASDYINKKEGCEDSIYSYVARELDGDSLFIKLVEEFERCILSYFAFHWKYAQISLSQVLQDAELPEPKTKLKNMVLVATRECLNEFKKAASSLLFAASRCSEFSGLQKLGCALMSHSFESCASKK